MLFAVCNGTPVAKIARVRREGYGDSKELYLPSVREEWKRIRKIVDERIKKYDELPGEKIAAEVKTYRQKNENSLRHQRLHKCAYKEGKAEKSPRLSDTRKNKVSSVRPIIEEFIKR